jgi:biopolymer transport protein ExbD
MAEIQDGGGGGGGKHAKKGRKKGGSPRIDMTPMVDLAFLLLTFFVLTSNLNKAKILEMAVPKEKDPNVKNMQIDNDLANTIILDGNPDGVIYFYHGKLTPDSTELFELKLDPAAKMNLRNTINDQNKGIQEKMKFVRETYKSGKLSADAASKIKGYVTEATQPLPNDLDVVKAGKLENFEEITRRLNADLQLGELQDTTYQKVSSVIRGASTAPFFIVKWGGDATYGEVINVIDELKIGDATNYALTKTSCVELQALNAYQASHGQTVRVYKELQSPDCQVPEAAPQAP